MKNLKYDPSLDVLRGIAVLLVLSSHFLKEYWYISALGTYGVTLFFILSGYLISGILINVKEQFSHDTRTTIWRTGVLRTFYIRRALRILPLYYSVLLLLVLLDVSAARDNWGHYFFFWSNHLYPDRYGYSSLSHFWSLAVEEQFYLVWPFIVVFLLPRENKVRFLILLIGLSVLIRFLLLFFVKGWAWYYLMPACMDAFAMGALVFVIKDNGCSKMQFKVLFFILSLLNSICFVIPYLYPVKSLVYTCAVFNRFLSGAFFSLLIFYLTRNSIKTRPKLFENRVLIFTGKVSYGLYVFHLFIPEILSYFGLKPVGHVDGFAYIFYVIACFGLTFLLAILSYNYFESPINSLKNLFSYNVVAEHTT